MQNISCFTNWLFHFQAIINEIYGLRDCISMELQSKNMISNRRIIRRSDVSINSIQVSMIAR